MRKIIIFLTLLNIILFPNFLLSHVNHYGNLKFLEYEIYLNNELIGTHIFNFKREKDKFSVTSKGYFKVKKLGIDLMNYSTTTKETYLNEQLDNFISETFQNDKRKYVNLKLNNNEKMFDIDGSSFKGRTDSNNIIGSWWNHEIINKNVQISAVSGRILPQKVKFLGKEKIILFDKKFSKVDIKIIPEEEKD
mgnify:CR=1 FL=1